MSYVYKGIHFPAAVLLFSFFFMQRLIYFIIQPLFLVISRPQPPHPSPHPAKPPRPGPRCIKPPSQSYPYPQSRKVASHVTPCPSIVSRSCPAHSRLQVHVRMPPRVPWILPSSYACPLQVRMGTWKREWIGWMDDALGGQGMVWDMTFHD
jgi:hypothetical protein